MWFIFKRRFYSNFVRIIKEKLSVELRIFALAYLFSITLYTVLAACGILPDPPHVPNSQTVHLLVCAYLWIIGLLLFYFLSRGVIEEARAELERQENATSDEVSRSCDSLPEVEVQETEFGNDASRSNDPITVAPRPKYWYGRYYALPYYTSRESVLEATEEAIIEMYRTSKRSPLSEEEHKEIDKFCDEMVNRSKIGIDRKHRSRHSSTTEEQPSTSEQVTQAEVYRANTDDSE